MKKILITSTAMVLMAGAAVAEVTVSGDGRMGVVYETDYNLNAVGNIDTKSAANFSSRIRIAFTASGETDGGLSFGGTIRADNAGGGTSGAAGNVWIAGEWGKLSMGDTVGAAEAVFGDLPETGYMGVSLPTGGSLLGPKFNHEILYLTGDGAHTKANNPVVLYEYSTGDFSIYASLSDGNVARSAVRDNQEYAVGFKYNFGDYSVGLAYEAIDYSGANIKNDQHLMIGGTATFGDTDVQAFYGSVRTAYAVPGAKAKSHGHYGIGVSSGFDAWTVNAFVQGYEKNFFAPNTKNITVYGVGVDYDLGGGAVISAGIMDDNVRFQGATKKTSTRAVADIGVKFKF